MRILGGVPSKISSQLNCFVKARGYAAQNFTLSQSRLEEFVTAELGYFAHMKPRPVRLGQIIHASTPQQVSQLIHKTLPVGYAIRVKSLEEVLEQSGDIPELTEVKKILETSFRNLRLVEVQQESNLEHLKDVIVDLRHRHQTVTVLMGVAAQKLKDLHHQTDQEINDWVDSFLSGRVGTEMLTQHFLTVHQKALEGSMHTPDPAALDSYSTTGIVDRRCDPGKIAQQAADNVQRHRNYDMVPIQIEAHACTNSQERIEFSFVPQYLQYMLEELLKNASTAVMNRKASGKLDPAMDKVRVVVAADLRQVRIQISDRGGGIPSSHSEEVWSYSWSTKKFDADRVKDREASPLAGFGMGLPMSRLYAEYLGGSLELMSLPGRGVDIFLDLMRIDPGDLRPGESDSDVSSSEASR